MPDALFQTPPEDWLTERALPELPLPTRDAAREVPEAALPAPLPVLFGAGDDTRLVTEVDRGLRLELDVFGSAFFMLTRYEELVSLERDEHGRFPLCASLADAAGSVGRALVNGYVDLMGALMRRLWPRLTGVSRGPRVLLTHDVDVPFSVRHRSARQNVRMIAGDVVKRGDPALAARRVRASLLRSDDLPVRDPAFTFDFIMRTGDRLGIQSSFYFLAEARGRKPGNYSLHEPWARSLLKSIAGRGHLLGLHASYDAYLSSAATRREFHELLRVAEAEGVTQETWGGRQHWLRWENPTTWRNWEAAGLDYDSTLTFADHAGFRAGTCHEFRPFDLRARRRLRLRERPLIIMDATALEYMAIGRDEAAAMALDLARQCRRHRGTLTLLWHNSRLQTARDRRWYEALIGALT
jgi:hypothetical protein